jgi:hypothetical protein
MGRHLSRKGRASLVAPVLIVVLFSGYWSSGDWSGALAQSPTGAGQPRPGGPPDYGYFD